MSSIRIRSPVFSSGSDSEGEPTVEGSRSMIGVGPPSSSFSAPAAALKTSGTAPLSLIIQFLDALGANQFHRAKSIAAEILAHEPQNRVIKEYSTLLGAHAQLLTEYNHPTTAHSPAASGAITGEEKGEATSSDESGEDSDYSDDSEGSEEEDEGEGKDDDERQQVVAREPRTDNEIMEGISRLLSKSRLPALHREAGGGDNSSSDSSNP